MTATKNKKNYKVYIWQHSSTVGKLIHPISFHNCIHHTYKCWQLIVSEVVFTEEQINSTTHAYNKESFIIFARQVGKSKNWHIGGFYSFNANLNIQFVHWLYKKYLTEKAGFSSWKELAKTTKTVKTKKKLNTYKYDYKQKNIYSKRSIYYDDVEEPKVIEDPSRTWIRDTLSCKTFPARSQKIKGLRYSTKVLERVLEKDYINKAIVISEEPNLEVKHTTSKYKSGRITLEEVLDSLVNNFVRPCPINPEHGFVDSRFIEDKIEAVEIIEEIRKTGEIPEMIVMPKIDCEYSGVICPDRIAFGYKNDGATQGLNSIGIALSLPPEGIEEVRNNFWTSKEWPFAEVLYNGNEKRPILVQLRSGPSMTIKAKKIKVVEVYGVNSSMDLIEWGKEAKLIRAKVIELNTGKDNNDIENTIAIWHPNGEFLSHFGVHCRTEEPILPYITSIEEPKIGEVIEIGVKGKPKLNAIKEGLILGLEAPITATSYNSKEAKDDLHSFLGGLHISSIADLGDEFTAKYIGYIWGIGIRIISGLPFGEAIHKDVSYKRTTEIIGEENRLDHERDYPKIWRLPIDIILLGLLECDACFLRLNWSNAYGGKAWSNCTSSLLNVFDSIRRFISLPSTESFNKLVESINIMVNEAHNGGWWLDKISTKQMFDDASLLPHFLLSPKRAFEVRENKIGMFQIKLKTIQTLKMLENGDLDAYSIKKEEIKKEREKKEKVKKQKEKIEQLLKLEKAKKTKEELDKNIEELKESLKGGIQKLQEELGSYFITGQYYISQDSINNNAMLHIQIESKVELGKNYGASININIGNGGEGKLLYTYYLGYKGKYQESLVSQGIYKYAPIIIWKGKTNGVCYLVTLEGVVIIPYLGEELWNLMIAFEKGKTEDKGEENENLF